MMTAIEDTDVLIRAQNVETRALEGDEKRAALAGMYALFSAAETHAPQLAEALKTVDAAGAAAMGEAFMRAFSAYLRDNSLNDSIPF